MHSVAELREGRLAGASRVKIAAGLREFPRELFTLADTLEILDLTGNRLHSLPDDFHRFQQLRILFLSENCFEVFPAVLAQCPALTMVGFKANQLRSVPEQSLPPRLRWLILTDNRLEALPHSIGSNVHLQKVMLAGNRLRTLPQEMAQCVNIELLRISANQLEALPAWLLTLPKLAWLAFAGNPCSNNTPLTGTLCEIHWDALQICCRLGEGASGVISLARWNDAQDVALKEFKGEVTSDGLPADEMAATIAAGEHRHLVKIVGTLIGHPQQKSGLLLALIDREFANLAGPPSLESCTRDVYAPQRHFTLSAVLNISQGIAAAAMHLHERGIMHGDLYAHNILVNGAADSLLGDFGAATRYAPELVTVADALQRIEVRAFGILLEELLERLVLREPNERAECVARLQTLQQRCMVPEVLQRPDFAELQGSLLTLSP